MPEKKWNSNQRNTSKKQFEGELEIQLNKFLHVFLDIINDITYLEFFSNLFFTSWQANPFPVFLTAEVIGLVEAEDLKPNDLVGVNKEPLHVLAVVFFCHSPSPFFPVNNEFRFVVASFVFAVTCWVV